MLSRAGRVLRHPLKIHTLKAAVCSSEFRFCKLFYCTDEKCPSCKCLTKAIDFGRTRLHPFRNIVDPTKLPSLFQRGSEKEREGETWGDIHTRMQRETETHRETESGPMTLSAERNKGWIRGGWLQSPLIADKKILTATQICTEDTDVLFLPCSCPLDT